MPRVRRSVRAIAIVWLTCQAASLAAFVPEQCCISHAEEAAAKKKADTCHESEPPAPKPGDACPMDQGDGAACPMHSSTSTGGCAMSNSCAGPGTHLITLFAFLGAIERPVTTAVLLESSSALTPPSTSPHFRSITPDSPPPKA